MLRGISINEPAQTVTATPETLAPIEEHVRHRLAGLLRDFQLALRDKDLYGTEVKAALPIIRYFVLPEEVLRTRNERDIR